MPSATTIRKHLLQALEETIVPTVQSARSLRMILADPPVDLPPEVKVTHLPIPLLREEKQGTPKFGQYWPDAHVNNFHHPYLAFVFEGEADLRVGITKSMAQAAQAKNLWTRHGCHILHLPAPTFLLFPPGVPHTDGTLTYWERGEPQPERIKIFWAHLLPTGALCHLGATEGARHEAEHPLRIEDEGLPVIVRLLHQEMKERAFGYQEIVQSQLLSLLLRLQRRLLHDKPIIGNTAWLPEPEIALSKEDEGRASSTRHIIEQADEFIQLHLSEPLALGQIAAHCDVSPTHLNRIFNSVLGTSAMRYVSRQRVRAACEMLGETEMSIKEIARLAGFLQVSHFCEVFARMQLISPGRYREQRKNATPPH
jgi:AraC-like DNA-binding protein